MNIYAILIDGEPEYFLYDEETATEKAEGLFRSISTRHYLTRNPLDHSIFKLKVQVVKLEIPEPVTPEVMANTLTNIVVNNALPEKDIWNLGC